MAGADAERESLLRAAAPSDEESGGADETLSAADAADVECRICRSGSGLLLRACRCASRVHVSCLTAWLRARASNTFPALRASALRECEVCGASCTTSSSPLGHRGLLADAVSKLSAALHSLEGCAAILLLALAVCGHALYLSAVLRGPAYHGPRAVLAVANAVATLALLVLAVRVLAKWVRERRFLAAVAGAGLPGTADGDNGAELPPHPPPGLAAQVALGATLSVVAALQVFLLLSAA